jgi:SPP1 gp7 family putative phage head morphogenesis protein
LRDLMTTAEEKIQSVYGDISGLTQKEMRGLVEISGEKIVTRVNRAIGADLLQPLNWTNEQIAAIADDTLIFGARSGEWWNRQATGMAQGFGDQMRMGMLRGESLGDLVKRVRSVDGLQGISSRNAKGLVRSSVVSTANAAHLAAFQANSDIMKGVEWTATLDRRTCARCGALDGKRWDLEGKPIDGNTVAFPGPTLHWGDRCTQIGVTKSWDELAGVKGIDDVKPGDRASMGGPVSGDTTFDSWLKDQPESVQRQVLGTGRYDLYHQGKLSLRDMMDQNGNSITLKELQAL